jgi:HEPN domain-containing protein
MFPESVRDQKSVLPPWVEQPFRLISWYDMNKFSAGIFVNIGSSLQWLSSLVKTGEWSDSTRESGQRFGESIAKDLREIGCNVAAQAAVRFAWDLPDKFGIRPESELEPRAKELQSVIFDEMRQHLFFWVPSERARYYEYPENPDKWDATEKALNGTIKTNFPQALTEINEARICYTVGRNTACVFHIMRACEVAIKAIYATLGKPPPSLSSSWGELIKPMDEQLKLKPSERHGDWATHPEFFDHATNDVRAIKRVWRDPTMHVDSDYDAPTALKAMNAVISFFEGLSTKLDQDGKVR